MTTDPSIPTLTWHLTVAYDGTEFHGWQLQPAARTVQGELLKRLQRVFRLPELKIYGTSRTDAGVHALDQHVSFETPADTDVTTESLQNTMNRWLPEDMAVTCVEQREADFHVRHNACGKSYIYVVHHGPGRPNPLASRFLWRHHRTLNREAMQACANLMVGTHDFSSFGNQGGAPDADPIKTIHRIEVVAVGQMLCICISGTSFLYKMVRIMSGYLVHVGTGAAAPDEVLRVLASCDRGTAKLTAPAQGLFLEKVFFEPEAWKTHQPALPPFRWPV
jgi:tRNA pseudouridine38-40 synthase